MHEHTTLKGGDRKSGEKICQSREELESRARGEPGGGGNPVNWIQQQVGSREFSRSKRVERQRSHHCRSWSRESLPSSSKIGQNEESEWAGGGASCISTDGTNPVGEVKNTGKKEDSEPYWG